MGYGTIELCVWCVCVCVCACIRRVEGEGFAMCQPSGKG